MDSKNCDSEGCRIERSDKFGADHIEGIRCDVTNCAYHGSDRKCHAPGVHVGPGFASVADDTACNTFTMKKE